MDVLHSRGRKRMLAQRGLLGDRAFINFLAVAFIL